jgi:hypothetical protein
MRAVAEKRREKKRAVHLGCSIKILVIYKGADAEQG